jgi:hypothetical protein
MSMPFAAIVLVGVGAYYLGKYDEKKNATAPAPVGPPVERPLPPLPPPLDSEIERLPASYAEEWEEALTRYEVDVYPPESVPHVDRLMPPPPPDGISVSSDCQTVAVGADWWAVAAQYADPTLAGGTVAERIMQYLAPSCARRNTLGSAALRQALVDWLRDNQMVRNQNEDVRVTRIG